jgi:glycerate-2-kinase
MGWDVYLTMCQFVNYASYDFLEEYEPNEAEKKDSQLFANNVRTVYESLPTTTLVIALRCVAPMYMVYRMARHLGIKTTEHSYGTSVTPYGHSQRLFSSASFVAGCHPIADVVLLSAARREHVNMDVIADEVQKFAHMDIDATRKLLKRFHVHTHTLLDL